MKIGQIYGKTIHPIARFLFRPRIKTDITYQETLLKKFIKQNKKTARGEKYNFKNIHSISDFQKNVPLVTYDMIQGYVEQMLQGAKNILRAGKIPYFSKSSGTTAMSKYIPITAQALKKNHYATGKDVFGFYLEHRTESMLFTGEGLIMGGRLVPNPFDASANNVGDVSAILQYNAPRYTKLFRKPSTPVSFMEQFDKKIDAMIEETKDRNITFVAGVPSRLTLFLQRLVAKTGKKNVLEIWPHLELFLRGGINIAPYKEQLASLLPGDQVWYWQNYNASEGFFAFQEKPNTNDMLLATQHNVFYEFVPLANIHDKWPETLLLSDLIVGEQYELIITTDGGLRRYRIGDVIQITQTHPLKIRLMGRTKSFLNAFGEELMEHTTDNAIQAACAHYNLPLADYVATAIIKEPGGYHQWYIDFGKDITFDNDAFCAFIDQTIQNNNSDYKAKRTDDLLLHRLRVTIVKPGSFHRYLESHGKLGGQHKIKRLWNEPLELEKAMGDFLHETTNEL